MRAHCECGSCNSCRNRKRRQEKEQGTWDPKVGGGRSWKLTQESQERFSAWSNARPWRKALQTP